MYLVLEFINHKLCVAYVHQRSQCWLSETLFFVVSSYKVRLHTFRKKKSDFDIKHIRWSFPPSFINILSDICSFVWLEKKGQTKSGREGEKLIYFFFYLFFSRLMKSSLFGFISGLSRRWESATSGWASRWRIKVFCCPPGVRVGDHRQPWRSQLRQSVRWHGLYIGNTVFRLTEGSFEVIVVCLICSAWNLGLTTV